MNMYPLDETTLQRFAAEIGALAPRPHHSGILEAAAQHFPERPFRYVFSRSGWYRPGGVLRPDGERLSADVEAWVEAELADCDGDMAEFLERHAEDGLMVTRHAGRTHYFVAPYGPSAEDFLQLEVEESQEVLDRCLIGPGEPPADPVELLEPASPAELQHQPVGPTRYRFRRLSDLRHIVARLPVPVGGQPPLRRFMQEWKRSRAAGRGHFSGYWVVTLRELQDRYHNAALSAKPVSIQARQAKTFHWNLELRGPELSAQLQAFERATGFPGAWYFHLVAGALVPRTLAYALEDDIKQGYSYLPDADRELLAGWIDAPYSF